MNEDALQLQRTIARGAVDAERERCAVQAHAYMIKQGFFDADQQAEAIAYAIRKKPTKT